MQSSSDAAFASSRACQNCSKAKAKCVPQANTSHSGCARCFRLGKECIAPVRIARKRRSPNALKNTTQLEQKIESLVSLLSTRGIPASLEQTTPPESQGHSEPSPPIVKISEALNAQQQRWVPEQLPLRNEWIGCPQPGEGPCQPMNPFTFYSVNPSTSAIPPTIPDGLDHLLDLYKEKFAPTFPFIVIPPRLSAAQLRAAKPWLLKAIYIVACQENRALQLEMSRQMLVEIPAAMLLRAEKSLDILQCLIIFNAWSHAYTPNTPASQSSGMLQLTLAMVFDLGLTKQYREMDTPTEILTDAISNAPHDSTRKEMKRSLDEVRTLLACYVLTSMTTYYMKRIDGLPRTSYIVHCCKILEDAAEYESDVVLITMIRLYGFVDLIHTAVTSRMNANEVNAPIWMQTASIRRELLLYWASVPPRIKENSQVLSTYHSTEVFIYRPSLHKHLFTSSPSSSSHPTPSPEASPHRLNMLYACLLASKSLLDHCLPLPSSLCLHHCIMDNAHIGHGLSILLKLTMTEEPGWDQAEVRETAGLPEYFEKFIAAYAEAGAKVDALQKVGARHSFPSGCAKVMGRVRAWYEGVLPKVPKGPKQGGEAQEGGGEGVGAGGGEGDAAMWMGAGGEGFGGGGVMEDFADYLNDAYWLEVIGNQNFVSEQ